jgi:hypothetical protein
MISITWSVWPSISVYSTAVPGQKQDILSLGIHTYSRFYITVIPHNPRNPTTLSRLEQANILRTTSTMMKLLNFSLLFFHAIKAEEIDCETFLLNNGGITMSHVVMSPIDEIDADC